MGLGVSPSAALVRASSSRDSFFEIDKLRAEYMAQLTTLREEHKTEITNLRTEIMSDVMRMMHNGGIPSPRGDIVFLRSTLVLAKDLMFHPVITPPHQMPLDNVLYLRKL